MTQNKYLSFGVWEQTLLLSKTEKDKTDAEKRIIYDQEKDWKSFCCDSSSDIPTLSFCNLNALLT